MITSSFHGVIAEIPGIAVDNFEDINASAFFLSHCHTDHTQGLFSKKLHSVILRHNVFIYMSKLTADIIVSEYEYLKNCIKILNIDTTIITLPRRENQEELYMHVTAIPAGHCIGSIMLMFKTNRHTILYTGDFRMSENDVCKLGQLHDIHKQPLNIDVMYVDTTFLHPKFRYLPRRSTVVDQLIEKVKDWLDKDLKNAIALSTSANYGYEFVFNEIYEKLNHKVYVDSKKFKFYCNHPKLVTGITNIENQARIHVCRRKENNHNKCLTDCRDLNFLFIRLSALMWENFDPEQSPINQISETRINVCFSTHCSRSELINFINYFSPNRTCGFPNAYNEDYSERLAFKDNKVDSRKFVLQRNGLYNERVKENNNKKVEKSILKDIFE